jgi:hypothetical protein
MSQKKPTNSELPAWLLPKEPHVHLQPPCPGRQVGVGLRPTLNVALIMQLNRLAGQPYEGSVYL